MADTQQRLAAVIGRDYPSPALVDRRYAKRVARYLLGVDGAQPDEVYDDVIVRTVMHMLRRSGYYPAATTRGIPWRSKATT